MNQMNLYCWPAPLGNGGRKPTPQAGRSSQFTTKLCAGATPPCSKSSPPTAPLTPESALVPTELRDRLARLPDDPDRALRNSGPKIFGWVDVDNATTGRASRRMTGQAAGVRVTVYPRASSCRM